VDDPGSTVHADNSRVPDPPALSLIVPAGAEVHLWRIDTMWRRSSTQRPGRHVVWFVVLIVVARGIFGLSAWGSPAGRFSSTSSLHRWVLDWQPSSRRNSLSARLKTGAIVAVVVNEIVNETRRNWRDGVRRGAMARTGD
jgi:hypothetical protein